jgi:hypothetical protein
MKTFSNNFRSLPVFLLILCACISRNNPWDPVNGCPEQYKFEILTTQSVVINKSFSAIRSFDSYMTFSGTLYDSMQHLDSITNSRNIATIYSNEAIRVLNDSIEKLNTLLSNCVPLSPKKNLDTLSNFSNYPETDIGYYRKQVEVESLKIASAISYGNLLCPPQGVYSSYMVDSLFLPVKSSLKMWDSLINRAFEYKTTLDTVYPKIISSNVNILKENLWIKAYNDSISKVIPYCGGSHVSTPEEIKNIINSLKPGDTLRIDTGSYDIQLDLSTLGNDSAAPIVIMGSPSMRTNFNPSKFFISNSNNIRIYNINFLNGLQAGIKIEHNSNNILIENCTFSYNAGHGMEIIESSVDLKNVRISNNLGSGIRIQGLRDIKYSLNADTVLIVNNEENGINSVTSSLRITNATISDNKKDGIRLEVAEYDATFAKTLITFNGGFGILRENTAIGSGYFVSPNTDFFGNTSGAMSADSMYIKFNEPYMQLDPMYQDKSANNYHIGKTSQIPTDLMIGYQD